MSVQKGSKSNTFKNISMGLAALAFIAFLIFMVFFIIQINDKIQGMNFNFPS